MKWFERLSKRCEQVGEPHVKEILQTLNRQASMKFILQIFEKIANKNNFHKFEDKTLFNKLMFDYQVHPV